MARPKFGWRFAALIAVAVLSLAAFWFSLRIVLGDPLGNRPLQRPAAFRNFLFQRLPMACRRHEPESDEQQKPDTGKGEGGTKKSQGSLHRR